MKLDAAIEAGNDMMQLTVLLSAHLCLLMLLAFKHLKHFSLALNPA